MCLRNRYDNPMAFPRSEQKGVRNPTSLSGGYHLGQEGQLCLCDVLPTSRPFLLSFLMASGWQEPPLCWGRVILGGHCWFHFRAGDTGAESG